MSVTIRSPRYCQRLRCLSGFFQNPEHSGRVSHCVRTLCKLSDQGPWTTQSSRGPRWILPPCCIPPDTLFFDGSLVRRFASPSRGEPVSGLMFRSRLRAVSLHCEGFQKRCRLVFKSRWLSRRRREDLGLGRYKMPPHPDTYHHHNVQSTGMSPANFSDPLSSEMWGVSASTIHLLDCCSQNLVFAHVARKSGLCRSCASLPERPQLTSTFRLTRPRTSIRLLPSDSVWHPNGSGYCIKQSPSPCF